MIFWLSNHLNDSMVTKINQVRPKQQKNQQNDPEKTLAQIDLSYKTPDLYKTNNTIKREYHAVVGSRI